MNAEDIAKALKHYYPLEVNNSCDGCPYEEETNCAERNFEYKAGEIIESLLSQLDAAIAGQETLQKALAESQRREKAAVEDMVFIARKDKPCLCDACKYQFDLSLRETYCDNCDLFEIGDGQIHFEWRGMQEGEPHETV